MENLFFLKHFGIEDYVLKLMSGWVYIRFRRCIWSYVHQTFGIMYIRHLVLCMPDTFVCLFLILILSFISSSSW